GAADAATIRRVPETADSPVEAGLATPVVAHVKDAATGEIALYVGEREVTIRDRHVAARLVRAAG
ncbi:MAG TPA: hypothetical protein VMD59_11345, partial [Acidimicrobiales bacterium]|nr:hypothetical protein [Acidimicrobiales bacterium]